MVKKDKLIKELRKSVTFILVGTSHPGNIGASARAIKTMGFSRMILVSPKEFPSETAFFRAKAATDVLEKIEIFPNLKSAISDFELVIGTSARNRKVPWPMINSKKAAQQIIAITKRGKQKIALVFGREDRGLTNEELGLCNLHVHIPASKDYSSLNLAQAVQIIAYEIRMQSLSDKKLKEQEWDVPLAKNEEIENLINHFENLMNELDFYEIDNPRKLLTRMRRFFKRSKIDHLEANVFRGVISSIQKNLKK